MTGPQAKLWNRAICPGCYRYYWWRYPASGHEPLCETLVIGICGRCVALERPVYANIQYAGGYEERYEERYETESVEHKP